jgi:hypothetical protein
MPIDFTTPGGELEGGLSISVPGKNPSINPSGLGTFPSKSSLVAGRAQILRPKLPNDIEITIRGLRASIEHWDTFQALIGPWMAVAQIRTGQLIQMEARDGLLGAPGWKPAWLTGDTYRSIHYFITTTPNTVMTSIGPTTFYAPLIEYGLGSHSTIGPRPFMLYGATKVVPELIQAYSDLAGVAKFGGLARVSAVRYKSDLERLLARYRARLYTIEKELGAVGPLSSPPLHH